MSWRDDVDGSVKSAVRLAEQGLTHAQYENAIIDLAKRLDAAEILVNQLQREVGFQIIGGELYLYQEAFGKRR